MRETIFIFGLLFGAATLGSDKSRENDSMKYQHVVDSGMAVTYRLTPVLEQRVGIDTTKIDSL